MKRTLKVLSALVATIIAFSCVTILDGGQTVEAASITRATIRLDSSFYGSSYDASETVNIPLIVTKYSSSDYGYYYANIYDENDKKVAYDSGSISNLSVGTTNVTVFWKISSKPHTLGTYRLEYYTSYDSGGSAIFYISTASGKIGTNLKWTLDFDGVLTISGSGTMKNFSYSSNTPWYAQQDYISKVVVKSGVTSIGESAFRNCNNLQKVSIASSVKKIGEYAFADCTNLESVTLPSKLTKINSWVFDGCNNLQTVTIPISVKSIEYGAFDDTDLSVVKYKGSKSMWSNITGRKYINGAKVKCSMKNLKSKTSITSSKRQKNRERALVKWKKKSGITGYEIMYSDSSNFSDAKKVKVKKASTTSKVIKLQWRYSTYYVKVRTYKKISGGYNYSDWSKTKKIK